MQELIAQVEELGIEINHTTSLVIIFGIIFLPPSLFILFCTKWCSALLRNARRPAAIYGCRSLRRTSYFTAAFTLQGIIVNVQAVLWLQKAAKQRKCSPPARSCG